MAGHGVRIAVGTARTSAQGEGGHWGTAKQLLQLPRSGDRQKTPQGTKGREGKTGAAPEGLGSRWCLNHSKAEGQNPSVPHSPPPPQGQPHKWPHARHGRARPTRRW